MNANASCGRTRIDFFSQTGAATCAPGKSMICCTGTLSASSANTVLTNLASHKVVRTEDNGRTMGTQAQVGATIRESFPMPRLTLSARAYNMHRIGRVADLPVSSSMANRSSQHPDSKHVSQSSRRRLGMLFSTCENSTRNGNQHRAPMKVSKASSEPIDPMLSKRWKESPSFSKLALARVRSREGQFPREAQSGTSLLQSAVRSIELASRPDAIRTMSPGTPLENFVLDHQPPTAWNPLGSSQRLYPQCFSCSARQGNWISRNGGRR